MCALVTGILILATSATVTAGQAPAPTDSTLRAAGARLRFRVSGRQVGPPVVLVHGYVGQLEEMDSVRNALAPDYRVIQMDVRTFGKSTGRSPSSADPFMLADDITRLLDRLHVPRAHLVGYSMGALISARFAARHPDRVSSLTLVAPAPLKTGQRRGLFDSTSVALLHGHGIDPLIIAVNPPGDPLPSDSDMAAIDKELLVGHDSVAWAAVVRNFSVLQMPVATLRRLTMPTTMIIGARDPMLEEAKGWTSAIPALTIDTIAGATHNDVLSKPELSLAVKRFLDSLASR